MCVEGVDCLKIRWMVWREHHALTAIFTEEISLLRADGCNRGRHYNLSAGERGR